MITISELIEDDKEQIRRLLEKTPNFIEEEVQVALELVDEALLYGPDEYEILCAKDENGLLAGYICFGPIPMTEQRYDLYWIVVDPKVGRRGVGRQLVRAMDEVLSRKGVKRLYIDTSSTPAYAPACRFYEKCGFQIDCVQNDFYRDGDDKVIYIKKL